MSKGKGRPQQATEELSEQGERKELKIAPAIFDSGSCSICISHFSLYFPGKFYFASFFLLSSLFLFSPLYLQSLFSSIFSLNFFIHKIEKKINRIP